MNGLKKGAAVSGNAVEGQTFGTSHARICSYVVVNRGARSVICLTLDIVTRISSSWTLLQKLWVNVQYLPTS